MSAALLAWVTSTDGPFLFQPATPSTRPKMMHPDKPQPQPHKDKTSLPQYQRVDNQLMDQSPKSFCLNSSFYLFSPLFTDKMEALALNSALGHCHVVCLPLPKQSTFSNTLLITKTTKREDSSLLAGLTRPARSPKVYLISLPQSPFIGISLTSWDQRLRNWTWG